MLMFANANMANKLSEVCLLNMKHDEILAAIHARFSLSYENVI